MDKEQFADWLDNDITKFFFKYLKDNAKHTAEEVAEVIITGGHFSQEEQIRIAAECMIMMEIAEIDFEDIELFYKET